LVMRLDPASTELSVAPLQTAQPVEWERLDFELMRLGNLGPNWDGEGAEAVSPVSVHTVRILLRLAREASARVPFAQYSLPSLFASIEGGICLKWDVGQRELKCVAVGETVEVIRWRSRDRFESDGFWELSAPKVAEHFEWLLR